MKHTAIITGAASGIGFETCKDLTNKNWEVFGIDSNEELLSRAAKEISNQNFKPTTCDITKHVEIIRTMKRISEQKPTVNALIACAGVLRLGPLAEMAIEEFDLVFNVNVRGLWLTARESLPMLRQATNAGEKARIILLSSISALRPKIDSGAYSASKAAVGQLTRVLSVECAKYKILVNAVAPGTVDTPMIRDQRDPETLGNWRPSGPSPLGRIAQPNDIVRVIDFLLSDHSDYITGATIPVDGGTTAAYVPPQ